MSILIDMLRCDNLCAMVNAGFCHLYNITDENYYCCLYATYIYSYTGKSNIFLEELSTCLSKWVPCKKFNISNTLRVNPT